MLTAGRHRFPCGTAFANHREPDAAFGDLGQVGVTVAARHARAGGDVVDRRIVLADVLEVAASKRVPTNKLWESGGEESERKERGSESEETEERKRERQPRSEQVSGVRWACNSLHTEIDLMATAPRSTM